MNAEEQWWASKDPNQMLPYIRKKFMPTQFRLFGSACLQSPFLRPLLKSANSRAAVEYAEDHRNPNFDDAKVRQQIRTRARNAAMRYRQTDSLVIAEAAWFAYQVAMPDEALSQLCQTWQFPVTMREPSESEVYAEILREVIGNPFSENNHGLSWLTPSIEGMARSIYDHRQFEDLPILADMMEEAGCRDEVLLEHCRSDVQHFRGCWAIEAVAFQFA